MEIGPNPQKTADLVRFTEEILNGKLHFLCSGSLVLLQLQYKLISIYCTAGDVYIQKQH